MFKFKDPAGQITIMAKFMGTSEKVATNILLNEGPSAQRYFFKERTLDAEAIHEALDCARQMRVGAYYRLAKLSL